MTDDTAQPWMTDALCTQMNPEMFYPDAGLGASMQTQFAKEACAMCPVRLSCLAYAMEMEGDLQKQYRHGIWGGLTPKQRHKLADRQAAA
jgi:WhiB family redox-sensing transcriptional regulator